MELRELMEQFSKKSGNELRDICADNFVIVRDYMRNHGYNDDDITTFLVSIWKAFVSADRKTRGDEYNLFIYSMGFSESEFSKDNFFEMTNHGADPDFLRAFRGAACSFDRDTRLAICTIGLCILGVDEEITDSEEALLSSLLD